MKLLGRLFKKRTPEPPVDVGPKRTPWTAEEDRLVLAARAMPVADRTLRGGESELQALARKLGRSPEAVTDRRSRLADPGLRDQLASERREREERDRKIIQLISHGASLGEAAGRSGVSKQVLSRMLKRKAPDDLDRTLTRKRGYERRKRLNRIARELAPRVLDAAADGAGLTLTAAEVAALAGGEKK